MSSATSEEVSWVKWFCSLRGNEFIVEVEEEYLNDRFNLTGLNEQVPHFKRAFELITDIESVEQKVDQDQRTSSALLEQAAELLYELIHSRYIITPRGINLMLQKYKTEDFGHCPRIFCSNQPTLPVGLSDVPGEDTVKLYCPKCRDVYAPKMARHQQLDGAFFGSGFPHMFFMNHPELRPDPPVKEYTPKLYGFKVHNFAYKMQLKAAAMMRSITLPAASTKSINNNAKR